MVRKRPSPWPGTKKAACSWWKIADIRSALAKALTARRPNCPPRSIHHDGHYDKRTVFADGLTFPNGVMPWKGGVFVTCAPYLYYFKEGHQRRWRG